MGPHSCECGISKLETRLKGALWLQWGRTPVSAESLEAAKNLASYVWLQWGRTPVSAESRELASDAYRVGPSFNGAALL